MRAEIASAAANPADGTLASPASDGSPEGWLSPATDSPGALSLSSVTIRCAKLLADALRLFHGRPISQRNRIGEIVRREHAEHAKRHLGADALHALQRAEPAALDLALEAIEPDRVFAHMRVDGQHDPFAVLEIAQSPRRELYLVADAAHIDDRVRFPDGIHDALEADRSSALPLP